MPNIDVTLAETSDAVRSALARDLTHAFCGATGFEREILGIAFHEYAPGRAAYGGKLLGPEERLLAHIAISCPRISRVAKQRVATEMTAAFRRATGWDLSPVIHISEHPYDNVVVEGQLLSDAFEECRRRTFYYPTWDRDRLKARIASGAKWEGRVGYSRLVRAGDHVFVTGTTATLPEGGHMGEGDAYAQAKQALENIASALGRIGAGPGDVVRTRLFVADIRRDWEAVGRAHAEVFGEVRPATTMVEVSRLIEDWMLVEIEADAVLDVSAAEAMIRAQS